MEELAQEIKMVECYLCSDQIPEDKAMDVPLTTGGKVKVHPSCMEFYLSSAVKKASSCGSCSGDAGCC